MSSPYIFLLSHVKIKSKRDEPYKFLHFFKEFYNLNRNKFGVTTIGASTLQTSRVTMSHIGILHFIFIVYTFQRYWTTI